MLEGMNYTKGQPFICNGLIILYTKDVKSIEIVHKRTNAWKKCKYPRIDINVSGVEYDFRFRPTGGELKEIDNLSEENKKIAIEKLEKKYLVMYKKFIIRFLYWLNNSIYDQFIEETRKELEEMGENINE